jgi:polyisoprenoid-binding protein YceI
MQLKVDVIVTCTAKTRMGIWAFPIALILGAIGSPAQTAGVALEFLPAQTTVAFTLGDTLHTVHGAFELKRGRVNYNPSTGEVSGEIVLDATSGHTGNGMRDKKMHKEILESAKYPEIIFRPDRVEGKVPPEGASTVQIHGVFTIHGADHEMTAPVQVEMAPDHWTATAHFVVPYEKWGIKNPSTFILRVSESVEIDVHATGRNPKLPALPQ